MAAIASSPHGRFRVGALAILLGAVYVGAQAPAGTPVSEVTYTKHVSRILQKNCQECHRPGQIGPFSLLGYEDAVAWGGMMREV